VDEELRKGPSSTRWLAWAIAGLLVAGAVSTGTVSAADGDADRRVVAAGGSSAGVDLPTTLAPLPTAPASPPDTQPPPPSTTTPPPPVTTAPPTTRRPTTTQAPTTTRAPSPSTTATTAASGAGRATVTVVNQFAQAVVVTLNGRVFELAPGQQVGPFEMDLVPNGNDSVGVRMVAVPTCGIGDAGGIFGGPGRYRVSIVTGPGSGCHADPAQPIPSPIFVVTRL
jgi:hypothetical protein